MATIATFERPTFLEGGTLMTFDPYGTLNVKPGEPGGAPLR